MPNQKYLFLFLIIFIPSIFFSQTDSTFKKNQLKFLLVNNLSLSYVKYTSENSGWLFGFDVSLNGQKENSTIETTNISSKENGDFEINDQFLTLDVLHFGENGFTNNTKFYYGAGPSLKFSRNKNSQKNTFYNHEITNIQYGFGLKLISGLRVNIYKSLSLVSEYSLGGYFLWEKQTNENINGSNKQTITGNGWYYSLSSLKLGIVYSF
ncbi:MAG: hypothetical protein ACOYU5_05820 [Stygiobacter sp.]